MVNGVPSSRFLDLRALTALKPMRFAAERGGRPRRKAGTGGNTFDVFRRLDQEPLDRRNCALIRTKPEEKGLACTVVIDGSGSMQFGAKGHDGAGSKLAYAQFLATALSHVIRCEQGEVGLAVVDSRLRTMIPPGATASHVAYVQEQIEALVCHPAMRMARGFSDLLERNERRGVLLLISDFLAEDVDHVFAALRRFDRRGWEVIVAHLVHPDEESLPAGAALCFEGLEGEGHAICSPAEIRIAYQKRFAAHLGLVRQLAFAAGCDYRRVSTAVPYLETLEGFLVAREEE